MKPKCYSCQYRRDVAGSAHSTCTHPDRIPASVFFLTATAMGSTFGGDLEVPLGDGKISGRSHGISKGWFAWPFDFDPVWLIDCDGYVEKEALHEHRAAGT